MCLQCGRFVQEAMTTEVLVFLREVQSAIAKSNSLSGALRVVPLHSTYHIRLEYVAVLILIVAGGSSNQKEACFDGLESRLKPRSLAGQQAAQPSGSAPPVRLGVFCSFLRPSHCSIAHMIFWKAASTLASDVAVCVPCRLPSGFKMTWLWHLGRTPRRLRGSFWICSELQPCRSPAFSTALTLRLSRHLTDDSQLPQATASSDVWPQDATARVV